MMNEKKIILLPEKMKAIARYETDFAEIMPFQEEVDDIDDAVTVPEIYRYTLDDLFAAVRNLIKKNPTIQAFYENWYDPLSETVRKPRKIEFETQYIVLIAIIQHYILWLFALKI